MGRNVAERCRAAVARWARRLWARVDPLRGWARVALRRRRSLHRADVVPSSMKVTTGRPWASWGGSRPTTCNRHVSGAGSSPVQSRMRQAHGTTAGRAETRVVELARDARARPAAGRRRDGSCARKAALRRVAFPKNRPAGKGVPPGPREPGVPPAVRLEHESTEMGRSRPRGEPERKEKSRESVAGGPGPRSVARQAPASPAVRRGVRRLAANSGEPFRLRRGQRAVRHALPRRPPPGPRSVAPSSERAPAGRAGAAEPRPANRRPPLTGPSTPGFDRPSAGQDWPTGWPSRRAPTSELAGVAVDSSGLVLWPTRERASTKATPPRI
jgi:hypothetical protein